MLGFSEGIDTHVSLPSFFSICGTLPLIIYFHLILQNMFSKITIFLLYYSVSVFKISYQIFILINILLVLRNISQKFNDLMLPNKSLSFITNNVKEMESS